MPTLRELEARFLACKREIAGPGHGKRLPDGSTQWGGFEVDVFVPAATLGEADGIRFECPKCYAEWKAAGAEIKEVGGSKYKPSVHGTYIWFAGRGAPAHIGLDSHGNAARWDIGQGSTGLDDLILTPSIQVVGGCNWHGFVGSSGVPPGHAA